MEAPNVDARVERLTRGCDLTIATAVLAGAKDQILARWLNAASDQPFHHRRRDHAVADHIPRLFDAVLALLQRNSPRWVNPIAPLDDPAVIEAARAHAKVRANQGLQPGDVVTEFRLLRQEILYALRGAMPVETEPADLLCVQLLINDAIDGAIRLGLDAIVDHVEELREDFLATTVHDVKNPITTIRAAVQLSLRLLDQPDIDANRLRTQLDRVVSVADSMTDLLNRLSEASRVALGRIDLQPEETDLVALARDVVARLPDTEANRIQIEAPPECGGFWDPTRLSQLLINLIANALKYSAEPHPVTVTIAGDEDTAEIHVRDEGVGILAEDIPLLFNRYQRARASGDRSADGLGLGLYLCRGIVEAHGGRIRAESAGRDQGTTMVVTLPRGLPAEDTDR
jgi:signal transduction histidine kinase